MDLHLVIPENNFVSGGNIYNNKLFRCLSIKHAIKFYPRLDQLTLSALGKLTNELIFVDSLFLPWLYTEGQKIFESNKVVGVIHLPQSMNPMITNVEIKKIESRAFKACSRIICTSRFLKERIMIKWKIIENKLLVIVPGIAPLKQKSDYSNLAKKLLCISNLVEGKGLEMLIASFQKLNNPELSLDIYGDDSLDTAYAEKIKSILSESSSNICYKHILPHSDLLNRLRTYDLLLCASEFETYGMAVAEAIQARLPYLSTRVGEYKYFSQSGLGNYCEPSNSTDFFDKLNKLTSVENFYTKLAENARHSSFIFNSWNEQAETLNKYIKEI